MKMNTYREWTHMDKSDWPRGEWDIEPDKAQWTDEATGLQCIAVRNPLGHWCGYVGVGPDHPFHGREYDGICDLNIHGGITFTDKCQKSKDEGHGICHIPEPGAEENVWWLGFNCAHLGDLAPVATRSTWREDKYKSLTYVQQECASLAKQLHEQR